MKIVVINSSGNVGKTTLSKLLFMPRIKNCHLLNVAYNYNCKDFIKVISETLIYENCIIDVNSNGTSFFFDGLSKYTDFIDSIDYFFVPTVPSNKQQHDSITTILTLLDLGVQKTKIKILLNQFDCNHSINDQFFTILNHSINKLLLLNEQSNQFIIESSESFVFFSHHEIINNNENYKVLLSNTNDPLKREILSHKYTMKIVANSINKELDNVFNKIKLSIGNIDNE
ncbi:hypothetical protein GLP30_17210 [Photobacterium phosphoreum]|uniref:CobQ/CobB/MinD/ParA nucleotide binding domain-containing protein n=1 Tax=Photobacterium phosphoreum TaxID=659 RepID=A0AAW5A1P3_PHOPO|nr:hypothetical protein [Photobacterium phosphoreum]MCD9492607.1 hypothetical protein [Photobacterium phosphoreum]MCF2191828.1 hypothetical protein [Photobacterium phosphoreum]MCF2303439.1 hypothetical protein [Photobacterium phosphoreum]